MEISQDKPSEALVEGSGICSGKTFGKLCLIEEISEPPYAVLCFQAVKGIQTQAQFPVVEIREGFAHAARLRTVAFLYELSSPGAHQQLQAVKDRRLAGLRQEQIV